MLIQCGSWVLVPIGNQNLAYVQTTEMRGEVQVRIGEATGRRVGIMYELWVGFENTLDEEEIVGVYCPSEAL